MTTPVGQISLRRATPEDRGAILNISAQIWEGNDYIPRVLDKWLADPQGELTLALVDYRVAGFSRLSWSPSGHGWLEGARVDPGLQGRGLGRALTLHHIGLARRLGLKTLRYSTSTDNLSSLALARRLGFRELGVWQRFQGHPGPEVPEPQPWQGEVPVPVSGLLALGWKVIPWQGELIDKWRQGGMVWVSGQAGIALVPDSRPDRMLVPLLWGPPEDAAPLLAFARHPRHGREKIVWVGTEIIYNGVLVKAGFAPANIAMVVCDFPLKEA